MQVSEQGIVGGRDLELLLLDQGRQVRRRNRVRLAAGLAVFPAAMACSVLLARFGGSDRVNLFASWLLIMLAGVLLIGGTLWWTACALATSVPRWPQTHRVAATGAAVASVVVTLTAILLARTDLFAGALLWTSAAVSAMVLWRYERTLDDRLSDLDNRILAQVGYR
jgi:hypothetical protein